MKRSGSLSSLRTVLDPGRYWSRAAEELQKTAAGSFVARFGQYGVLPLLAIAGGLGPSYFGIRWTFAILVIVMYALLRSRSGLFGLVVLGAMLVYLPHQMDTFERGIMFDIALYALLGIGLNVVVGYAGLLDLGYVAFFASGAYLYALISAPHFGGGFDVGTSYLGKAIISATARQARAPVRDSGYLPVRCCQTHQTRLRAQRTA